MNDWGRRFESRPLQIRSLNTRHSRDILPENSICRGALDPSNDVAPPLVSQREIFPPATLSLAFSSCQGWGSLARNYLLLYSRANTNKNSDFTLLPNNKIETG